MTDVIPRLEEKDIKTEKELYIIGSIDNDAIAKNEVSLIFKPRATQ